MNLDNKKLFIKYLEHIEQKLLSFDAESEVIAQINDKIKESYDLVERGESAKAFEGLSEVLVEHFMILDRDGIKIANEIVEQFGLDENWQYRLRRINSLGYVEGSWKLVDSEELAKQYKYTFYKPSKKIIDHLQIGNIAKMTFEFDSTNDEHPGAERMWVLITEVNDGKFKGELNNNPFFLHELWEGDEITFEHKHVIDHDLDMREPNLVDKYIDRCFVTSKVLYDGHPVNYLYREEPMEEDEDRNYEDSGWRILAGDETDEYMDDSDNIHLVSLGAVLTKDDSFVDLLEAPIGATFERNDAGEFVEVKD